MDGTSPTCVHFMHTMWLSSKLHKLTWSWLKRHQVTSLFYLVSLFCEITHVLTGVPVSTLQHKERVLSCFRSVYFIFRTGAVSGGIKRLQREANHSPPSSADVKNAWSYTSTRPIRLHGVVLSKKKHRDYFTLLYWRKLYEGFHNFYPRLILIVWLNQGGKRWV
jgi:hypothetical protein